MFRTPLKTGYRKIRIQAGLRQRPNSIRRIFSYALALAFIMQSGMYAVNPGIENTGPGMVNGMEIPARGPVPLDCKWEFYWMQLYSPHDFTRLKPQRTGLTEVPGVWNGFDTGKGSAPGDGYATYRLIVKDLPAGSYGLKIPSMATAYRLWVNDIEAASNGKVAGGEHMIPQQMPDVAFFKTSGEDISITVQVSNYMSDKGGIWGHIYLGTEKSVIRARIIAVALDMMLFGCIFIMSVYHIGLYLFRKKSRFALWFGIVCFAVSLKILLSGEFFMVYMFPGLNWYLEIKLEFLTVISGFAFFIMFLRELFPGEFTPRPVRSFQIAGVLAGFASLVFPVKVFARYLPVYHILIIAGFCYIILSLVIAVKRKRNGAVYLFSGCVILVLVLFNDILDSNIIIHTGYVFQYGLLAFIFTESVVLSKIISGSFNSVEELSEKLIRSHEKIDEYSKTLELKVAERTEELAVANEKLRDLDRAKTDFFANISHELRTPLTLILAPVDEALKGKPLDRESLESIERNGRNLRSLINDLLDISRIDAGRMVLHVTEIDLCETVRYFCGGVESSAKLKGIDLGCLTCGRLLSVFADPERIKNIIANLFSNSFKFTDPGGKIEVSTGIEGGYAVIKFSDTGSGIPSDKVDTVFDRFTQADTTASRRYEGTGIGLSIVKELAELHGGTVSVESRYIDDFPENHGTVFTVKIPRGREHFEGRKDIEFMEGEAVPCGNIPTLHVRDTGINTAQDHVTGNNFSEDEDLPAILVVEDNGDLRRLLVNMLSVNYSVYQAANGREAVDILNASEDMDLVLSDIMMPGMDGHELLKWIRADERFEGLPVVFLTARADSFMKLEGLDLGAIDYVTKPFNSDELELRIRNQMEFRRLRNSQKRNCEKLLAKLKAVNDRPVTEDNIPKFESICEFIRENCTEELNRVYLAEKLNLNPDTFSRMFKRFTGKTLYDYINEHRVNEAKKRLIETNDKVTFIGMDTGFESLRTFNRAFKKFTGMKPVEFRGRKN